jgi:hypothetical protein
MPHERLNRKVVPHGSEPLSLDFSDFPNPTQRAVLARHVQKFWEPVVNEGARYGAFFED